MQTRWWDVGARSREYEFANVLVTRKEQERNEGDESRHTSNRQPLTKSEEETLNG